MTTENSGNNKTLVAFKPSNGITEYRVIIDKGADTIWATELQIATIFGRDRTVINKHIKNIYKEGELSENSTCAIFALVREEKDRKVEREVLHYNLDVILSVGYRVRSPLATEFRIWATAKLKEYLLQGYTVNQQLLQSSTEKIDELKIHINYLNEISFQNQQQITEGFLSIISHYSKSFELLNKFDSEKLSMDGLNEEVIYEINYKDVKTAIRELKTSLMENGEASAIFGNEKDKSFEGILGSISQTVFGRLAYPTIEEQAAQLLYSIIKGHAFNDGNKRIGSFVFVWFLEQNNFHLNSKGKRKIDNNTLTTLALVVAQSLPEQRDLILKLIVNLIKRID
jgi:death-on-curing family protein